VIRAIAATDFQGFVGQEFIPTGEPAAALAEACRICGVSLVHLAASRVIRVPAFPPGAPQFGRTGCVTRRMSVAPTL